MPKKQRRATRLDETFLDGLLKCIAEALKKEGLKFTEEEKRKCACILIGLAHAIVEQEFKGPSHWPQT